MLEDVIFELTEVPGIQFRHRPHPVRDVVRTTYHSGHGGARTFGCGTLRQPAGFALWIPPRKLGWEVEEDVNMVTHCAATFPHPDVRNSVTASARSVADPLHQLTSRADCVCDSSILPANRQVSVHRSSNVAGMLQCPSNAASCFNLDLFGLAAADGAPKRVRGQPKNTPREDSTRSRVIPRLSPTRLGRIRRKFWILHKTVLGQEMIRHGQSSPLINALSASAGMTVRPPTRTARNRPVAMCE